MEQICFGTVSDVFCGGFMPPNIVEIARKLVKMSAMLQESGTVFSVTFSCFW